jgi:Flp pilus assembly protein CpaB
VRINLKFFATLQFWLGLLLAGGAVVAFVLLGQVLNPTPLRVVVAREDIQRGDILTEDVLMVSKQQLSPSLASYYVQESDLPLVLGGVAVDSIYKGDPIAKMRLAVGQDIEKARRLSAALGDTTKVIRVIPVKPDNCPSLVYPGDVIEIGFSLSGQMPSQIGPKETPQARGYNVPVGGGAAVEEEGEETFDLPASKVVLRDVLVLRVEHKQIPNPNYGAGVGSQANEQPAFLKGDVERLVVLVGEQDSELLDFAIHNGKLSVGLRSYLVRDEMDAGEEQPATLGVTWTDFDEWFRAQRLSATEYYSSTVRGANPEEATGRTADRPEIVMARDLNKKNEPIQATDTFGPDDEFYFSVPMTVTEGSTLSIRWTYDGEVIYEEAYAAEGENAASVWGRLANEEAWPEGEYTVAILDGADKELASTTFKVKEG